MRKTTLFKIVLSAFAISDEAFDVHQQVSGIWFLQGLRKVQLASLIVSPSLIYVSTLSKQCHNQQTGRWRLYKAFILLLLHLPRERLQHHKVSNCQATIMERDKERRRLGSNQSKLYLEANKLQLQNVLCCRCSTPSIITNICKT